MKTRSWSMSASLKSALKNSAAIVALWAPVYFSLVDRFGLASMPQSELLKWALVAVGISGLGTILHSAWKDTRDPTWRGAHRLPRLGAARIGGSAPTLTRAELRAGA
jgi:hypothetical protein